MIATARKLLRHRGLLATLVVQNVVGASDDFTVSGIEAWRLTAFAGNV